MALCVCKCLNVTLESDKIEQNVDIVKLDLTPTEQRDIFFSEKLLSSVGSLKISIAQSALTGSRTVGRWTIHFCLACGQTTHATAQDRPHMALICQAIQTTAENVNNLKKSSNFSLVFNLLVPEMNGDVEMKENIDTSNLLVSDKLIWPPAQQVIGMLSKQLSQTLQSQLEAIEETVRQFRDQKYAEFEAYREKAQRDHKILASIVSKARNTGSDGWRMDTTVDNGPPSPQLPPLQRRRLSSIKDAKKISQNHVKNSQRNLPPEEDSLDAEDIFDLEGMDSHPEMGSDQDDYDSDNSGSDDEGIHIARARAPSAADVARSLPINMPFPLERADHRDRDDDEEPSQDIAASIKALAKSVHGDVFELPRPRFSTQI
ncbi:hypothetical protein JYU34_009481 [Plutella xylostella]|uniref:Uncharacterized protein n=1 Tax=Plutella xylostella TaxID=51655 RepID=A0ABQ7QJP8_PLUXY|nr:hypothetical protein JYU34_009481 [Plutella xylostella]